MISIYNSKTQTELNLRKQEAMDRYVRLIQWGRANPTRFVEQIFKVQLMDYQKYVFLNTWNAEVAAWVMSRNAAKSFLGGLYMMTRATLFPSYSIYIMSTVARQSKDTFLKLENIAKKNISSVVGSSDVFMNEVVKSNANTDGFTHNATTCQTTLFNGSTITSLAGDAKSIVGIRSNLNFYDEAGKIDSDFFALTKPFCSQNSDFKLGTGFDSRVYPQNISNQIIYASSAEGIDTELFQQYKECAKNMMMGIPGFFVADISCEIPLHPTLNGEPTEPLLKQSEIDNAMRINEGRALREYYNIFDTSGGSDALVSRSIITKSRKSYLPVSESDGDDKHYVLCYDPALQADNAFVLIMEVIKDPVTGYKGKIVNGINLIERLGPTDKRPLRTPEQIEWIRNLLLQYNGHNPDYKNVILRIDAGAGGNGRGISDILMLPWNSKDGVRHSGIWDSQDETEAYKKMHDDKYTDAYDCLQIVEPRKWRTSMFTDLSEMFQGEYIELPIELPRNGEVTLEDGTTKRLTDEEMRALLEIDLMTEEIMAMQKTKSASGEVKFSLPPSRSRKMHDDRCYCMALAAGYLANLRREDMAACEKPQQDFMSYLKSRSDEQIKKIQNPFAGKMNPFAGKRW